MRYGYFDDKEREYVIDRPDTPSPWVNYLGSPEYLSGITGVRSDHLKQCRRIQFCQIRCKRTYPPIHLQPV